MVWLAPLLAAIVACSSGPTPIAYGEANCDFCGMTVSDNRFGAELVTARGKTYLFDSAECMAAYYAAHDTAGKDAPTVWVTDFQRPGTLIPAQQAQYIYGATRVHSPMGRGLLALAPTANAAAVARDVNGTVMSWSQLLATVEHATHESGETASATVERPEHVHASH